MTDDLADRLRDMERRRVAALVAGDGHRMNELHADDYELISGGGGRLSRAEYLDPIAAGDLRYVTFEPASEIAVRVYQDVAVLRYLARIDVRFGDAYDRGLFWHTDLYERTATGWRAVWSQATPTDERETG